MPGNNCWYCKSANIVKSEDDLVCTKCGFVQEEGTPALMTVTIIEDPTEKLQILNIDVSKKSSNDVIGVQPGRHCESRESREPELARQEMMDASVCTLCNKPSKFLNIQDQKNICLQCRHPRKVCLPVSSKDYKELIALAQKKA